MIYCCDLYQETKVIRVYCIANEYVDVPAISDYVAANEEAILKEVKPEKYNPVDKEYIIDGVPYLLRFALLS